MPDKQDIAWFKEQFQSRITNKLVGTPFSVDMIVALACQETGEVWPVLRKKGLSIAEILRLCVGDTLDADKGRSAFPKNKTELLAAKQGQQMFDVAHQALVDMAVHIKGYAPAAARPNKFCRGFGLFQRDLQFFKEDPSYFLNQKYADFDQTLQQCLNELKRAVKKLQFEGKTSLTDMETAAVAICYNTGGFKPANGLKQGYFNGSQYYGEAFFDLLRLSQTVAVGGETPKLHELAHGNAILPPASPLAATGDFFKVNTEQGMLNLRSEPAISDPSQKNVIAALPFGHPVRAVSKNAVNGFREIETSLSGALLRGYCSAKLLVRDATLNDIEVIQPAASNPVDGIIAVNLPVKAGQIIRRSEAAGARPLNEKNQPGRTGTTAEALRAELGSIVSWLAVDNPAHLRYQPHSGLTFCNIYAHDYCHLAGAYLPRVWWTQRSVIALSKGETVPVKIDVTVDEMRANNLFRWFRDFGPGFGWRQASSLSDLQQEVNQGAIGIIVARRREEGRSGHIVVVVPETAEQRARRDSSGAVTAPLQSQAGATNFQYGTGRPNWWKGEEFAESAFWLHA